MCFEVWRAAQHRDRDVNDATEDALAEAFRDLARWLYRNLYEAYEAECAEDTVAETMAANGWTFTEQGTRFG